MAMIYECGYNLVNTIYRENTIESILMANILKWVLFIDWENADFALTFSSDFPGCVAGQYVTVGYQDQELEEEIWRPQEKCEWYMYC